MTVDQRIKFPHETEWREGHPWSRVSNQIKQRNTEVESYWSLIQWLNYIKKEEETFPLSLWEVQKMKGPIFGSCIL